MMVLSIIAASACGSPQADQAAVPSQTGPPPAATPAPAGATDVNRLVIQAEDIPLPGFSQQGSQPIDESGVKGVAVVFGDEAGTRQLGETIVLLPDADAARRAMQGAVSSTQDQRPGVTTSAVPIGDSGVLITGYELGGTASTMLLFSQGVASVAMDFRSAATDPVPVDIVTAVGARQADLLRRGLG